MVLGEKFEKNLTEATNSWEKHVFDKKLLSGLPKDIVERARAKAEEKGLDWYIMTLDDSTVTNVSLFADNRELRKEYVFAHRTRASEFGPPERDNTALCDKILALRHEQAQLLGFANYAERSIATKMAETTDEVLEFLHNLAGYAKTAALKEHAELLKFAKERDGLDVLEQWDIGYYTRLYKQEKLGFSEMELRDYFPLPRVLSGMFDIVGRLYGVSFREEETTELWHPDAKLIGVYRGDTLVAGILMDFYSRQGKRGGAWMDDAVFYRKLANGDVELPIAYLTCNFIPPNEGTETLLLHSNVSTLFHEFGHSLNHVLTVINEAMEVSGINGVEWDAVELPSQFMEGFCEEKESLDMFARHYKTGEKIPDELFQKMRAARNFGEGFATIRQLNFSLYDFRLYLKYQPGEQGRRTLDLFDEVYKELFPLPACSWMRFPNTFAHIFAGGYSAGYYSYKWAEVLSDDIFSPFVREDGTINWSLGQKFLDALLSRGGSRKSMENVVDFLGRPSSIEAHLKKYGFVE